MDHTACGLSGLASVAQRDVSEVHPRGHGLVCLSSLWLESVPRYALATFCVPFTRGWTFGFIVSVLFMLVFLPK